MKDRVLKKCWLTYSHSQEEFGGLIHFKVYHIQAENCCNPEVYIG